MNFTDLDNLPDDPRRRSDNLDNIILNLNAMGPVQILRSSKPVAVMISIEDYEALQDALETHRASSR